MGLVLDSWGRRAVNQVGGTLLALEVDVIVIETVRLEGRVIRVVDLTRQRNVMVSQGYQDWCSKLFQLLASCGRGEERRKELLGRWGDVPESRQP